MSKQLAVVVRFEFSDYARRVLAHRTGEDRLATRAEIRTHIRGVIRNLWDDYAFDFEYDVDRVAAIAEAEGGS